MDDDHSKVILAGGCAAILERLLSRLWVGENNKMTCCPDVHGLQQPRMVTQHILQIPPRLSHLRFLTPPVLWNLILLKIAHSLTCRYSPPSVTAMNPQLLSNGTPRGGITTKLPESWNLYRDGFRHPRTQHIGQHAKDSTFPFTLHNLMFGGQFGKPALFLHEGTSKKDTKIAAVKHIKYYNPFTKAYWVPTQKNNFRVLLNTKASTGEPFKVGNCQAIDVACLISMHLGGRAFAFSLDVHGVGYAQSFEWRQSNGPEVRSLHSGPEWMGKSGLAFGWVLVWLNSPNTAARRGAAGRGGREGPKQGGFRAGLADKASAFMSGGDDGEVVAVWAEGAMKGSKLGLFRFMGSGKAQLGDQFMVVAVMTAMQIYAIEVAERQAKATESMNKK